jgi:hypothetical protein
MRPQTTVLSEAARRHRAGDGPQRGDGTQPAIDFKKASPPGSASYDPALSPLSDEKVHHATLTAEDVKTEPAPRGPPDPLDLQRRLGRAHPARPWSITSWATPNAAPSPSPSSPNHVHDRQRSLSRESSDPTRPRLPRGP